MDQIVSVRSRGRSAEVAKVGGSIFGETSVAALTVGWTAFLLWLTAEIVIAFMRWR